jgi:hypothetical protein
MNLWNNNNAFVMYIIFTCGFKKHDMVLWKLKLKNNPTQNEMGKSKIHWNFLDGRKYVKGANMIILQKDYESFLVFFIWNNFEWNFLQLVTKNTNTCLNRRHFCVNHCWININFSKCVNFVKFFISSWNLS